MTYFIHVALRFDRMTDENVEVTVKLLNGRAYILSIGSIHFMKDGLIKRSKDIFEYDFQGSGGTSSEDKATSL